MSPSQKEHRAVLAACRAGDAACAARLVSQHVEAAARALVKVMALDDLPD